MPKSAKTTGEIPKGELRLKQSLHIDRDLVADWKQLDSDATRDGRKMESLSDMVNRLLRPEIARLKAARKPTV